MGKVSQNSSNYVIKAKLESDGVIEKSDIIGAIFGQTEGLLGEDLDLRELRNHGKVGRFEVELNNNSGSTEADIEISTSLDAADTAILAASLETIEKVGPTHSDIKVEQILDVRTSKRDYILKRSKQLLENIKSDTPEMGELKKEIKQSAREAEIIEYEGFDAGPEVRYSDEIILVEGVADVRNLVKNGVKNALALGGTSVPNKVSEIVEDRKVTAFLDGDRGGDLILEELKTGIDVDHVARAPEDKEVEELSEKKIFEAIRDKEPLKYVEETEGGEDENLPSDEELEKFQEIMSDLVATRAVNILDSNLEVVSRMPIDNASKAEVENAYAILADGEISESLINLAENKSAEYIIGRTKSGTVNSSEVKILTSEEIAPMIKE